MKDYETKDYWLNKIQENKDSLDTLRDWIKDNPETYEKLPEIVKKFIASGQAKKYQEILEYKDFIRKNF